MDMLYENVLRVSGYHDDIVCFDERFRKGRKETEKNYHFDHLYPTPHLNDIDTLKWRKENWSVQHHFFFAVTVGVTLHSISPLTFLSESKNVFEFSISFLTLAIVVFLGLATVFVIVP